MKKVTILALAVVAMVGCKKESIETEKPATPVAAKFTQGVITRTSGNNWVENDKIGITMTQSGVVDVSNSMENIVYSASQSAATTDFVAGETVIYYPQDGSAVDFYAYYPHQESMQDGIYKVDVSSGVESNIDLLRAFVDNKTKTDIDVPLTFMHRLSQLTMNITRGAGISTSAITAKLVGSNTTADYNIYNDEFSGAATVAEVPVDVDSEIATVVVVPQVMSTDAMLVFTIDGSDYYWSVDGKTFDKGKNHVYNITIEKTGITVNGSTIADWEDVNEGDGTAE